MTENRILDGVLTDAVNAVNAATRQVNDSAVTVGDVAELMAHLDVAVSELRGALLRVARHGGDTDVNTGGWNVTVLVDDPRCPSVIVEADTAEQAAARAVEWAVRERNLPRALVSDSAHQRAVGGGTRQVEEGRWQVSIEGW